MFYNFAFFLTSVTMSIFVTYLYYFKIQNFVKTPNRPQIIHKENIPRFGGLSIFLTLSLISIFQLLNENNKNEPAYIYCLVIFPVFIFGFLEDLNQNIRPKIRFGASVLSAILCILIYEIQINDVGISIMNFLLEYKYISLIFTILCITYLIQAFNIIDGLNGLNLFTAIIIFILIATISDKVNDLKIYNMSIFFISILSGILIFNFPYGKIFLGDSGAYIVGVCVSISILSLYKNNLQLSPFLVCQILIYPSYELLRSCLRRFLVLKKNILEPDTEHLHSLIYKINFNVFLKDHKKANYISSMEIIILQIINAIYIFIFFNNENKLIIGLFCFILIYEVLYFTIKRKLKT